MKRHFADEWSEAGETLIEVIIAAALMGLVAVAIIGGLATTLIGSTVHRKQTDANTVLVASMEQVKSPDVTRACAANDPSHPYRSGLSSTITIKTIEYQTMAPDALGNPTVVWSTALTDCSLPSPLTLQRITLQYAASGSAVNPELSFVKGAY